MKDAENYDNLKGEGRNENYFHVGNVINDMKTYREKEVSQLRKVGSNKYITCGQYKGDKIKRT